MKGRANEPCRSKGNLLEEESLSTVAEDLKKETHVLCHMNNEQRVTTTY